MLIQNVGLVLIKWLKSVNPKKTPFWVLKQKPKKNFFIIFFCFSFLKNRRINVVLVGIFENAQIKLLTAKKSQIAGLGIRSFAHSSFAHFAQINWGTVSDLLRSLKTNERLWANRSGRSRQRSDCEWFAQVAHDRWANETLAQKFLAKQI